MSLSAIPLVWSGVALVMILSLSFSGYRTLRSQPAVRFRLRGEQVFLLPDDPDQPLIPVRVRRGWQFSAWLFQLQYRHAGQRRWQSLLVWPDSACAETRRILRSHEAFGYSASDRPG